MPEPRYPVFGYDKDGDVHEKLCACPSLSRAEEIASALARSGRVLRRSENGEPFDWLVVARSGDPFDRHKVYTDRYPDGFQPPF